MRCVKILSLAASLALFGCQSESTQTQTSGPALKAVGAPPVGEGRAKVWLTMSPSTDGVTLVVNYERGKGAGARVADINIAHSDSIELVSAELGAGAANAGKELTTQEPKPGVVRLVLLSRDTNELETGELAHLTFKRLGATPIKADFLMDKPMFAPVEAMQGLLVGDPVAL